MTHSDSTENPTTQAQQARNSEFALNARGVTVPQGFRAASVKAGIKVSGNTDLALVVNDGPEYSATGVFTRNRVVAAPVTVSRQALADGCLHAVVYNAGNANACNGALGLRDAKKMQAETAQLFGFDAANVAVCSTGLIGEPMPMENVVAGIGQLPDVLGCSSCDHDHGYHRQTNAGARRWLEPRRNGQRRRHDGTVVGNDAGVLDDGPFGHPGTA